MDTLVFKESITYTHTSLFTEINHLPTILIFSRHPKTTCYTIPFLITYPTIQVPNTINLKLLLTPSKTSFRLSPKIVLSSTFHSDGPYVTTTHTLTFSNLNLTIRILGLTHTKSTIALYHKSLIKIATPSIPLSFLSTPAHTLIFTVSFH